MQNRYCRYDDGQVSLFTREWIEIVEMPRDFTGFRLSPSLRGSGLKLFLQFYCQRLLYVSLFTREWIEIVQCRLGAV